MRKTVLLVLLAFCAWMATPAAAAAGPVPAIRVGLWTNQVNIHLSADVDFSLVDSSTAAVVASFRAKQRAALSIRNGQITLGGNPVGARDITVVPAKESNVGIEVNSHHYRGAITVHQTAGKPGLTVVDTLPVEEYLYGVIAREIAPDWPAEALKAQAVASRTYALYSINKHQDDGFDVDTTTDCQVYGGTELDDPRIMRAVADTRGLVVTYQGKLIPAFFHSSGGGYTENSENVWGGAAYPFLRGVADFDQQSPQYKWEKTMTQAELGASLEAAGYQVGLVEAVELSTLTEPSIATPDRGVSGRVKTIRILGSTGTVELTGARLRGVLGLNSALFDVAIVVPTGQKLEVELVDGYGRVDKKELDIDVKPLPERRLPTDKPDVRRFTGQPGETIVFRGFGWGHGIGLSQWGAKAMAEKAPPQTAEYFRTILKHYYTGVEIEKLY